jgi:hypothetical protein
MRPNPEILLGHEIFWQEKRDGSNMGVYLDDEGKVQLRSRNMEKASEDIYAAFHRTEEASKLIELLVDLRDKWHQECVIFGELLKKGKSPTRTELHDKDEFIVFDIWSNGNFVPYVLVHQYCYQYKLPIVELYGTSRHVTMESLLKFRDEMLKTAKKNGREGVVGKTFEKMGKFKYFKEKLDLPQLEKKPRHIEDGEPQLPPLPESEILGALDKVRVDIGEESFGDTAKAMPLFASYVADECRKHNCSNPRQLFGYYKRRLEDDNREAKGSIDRDGR